jgi:anti-sigma B factor antagonist
VRSRLHAALTAVAAGGPDLVVDLSRLGFIDASCVRELWQASRQLQQHGGLLKLAAPQPLVARMLALCGTDRVIEVHDSVALAVLEPAG